MSKKVLAVLAFVLLLAAASGFYFWKTRQTAVSVAPSESSVELDTPSPEESVAPVEEEKTAETRPDTSDESGDIIEEEEIVE